MHCLTLIYAEETSVLTFVHLTLIVYVSYSTAYAAGTEAGKKI